MSADPLDPDSMTKSLVKFTLAVLVFAISVRVAISIIEPLLAPLAIGVAVIFILGLAYRRWRSRLYEL